MSDAPNYGPQPINGEHQKRRITPDDITDALSQCLDQMQVKFAFTLADVIGGIRVLQMQVEEQIIAQYRASMGSRLAQAAHAQEPPATQ